MKTLTIYRCVKAALFPSSNSANWTFCTRSISNWLQNPTFGENFPLPVQKNKLNSKTLQVTIWSETDLAEELEEPSGNKISSRDLVSEEQRVEMGHREECLGSAQVSLADFDVETVSIKWYNVLSFHFMQQPREKVIF